MERQTLQRYKARLKLHGSLSRDEQMTLVQNALEALDKVDGGKPIAELRQALSERENSVKEALTDLEDTLTEGVTFCHLNSTRGSISALPHFEKSQFIVELIRKMLRTGKTKDFKSWKDWRVVIEEEFGHVH
jgi:hypothetical protein